MASLSDFGREIVVRLSRNGGRNGSAYCAAFSTLLLLDLAVFADVLFWGGTTVLSKAVPEYMHEELFRWFIHLRDFGFRELRNGNLALWNPHIFSGTPNLGAESGLLYPLNAVYLVLPLAKAINADIAINFFLSGVFMFLWTLHRRLHPFACLLASVLFMFCGAHFMQMYPGHLTNLCVIPWVPLVLLAIDGLIDRPSLGWCLLGMFAVAMQVFATHPQSLYYTGLNALFYTGLNLIRCTHRLRLAAGFIAIYVGAVCLASVQLLTEVATSPDSLRAGGLSFRAAAIGSFPPENFLTLLAPGFFGGDADSTYWGGWILYEVTLFLSVTGLFLAVYGAIEGNPRTRRFSVALALVFMVMALGAYSPLFPLLRAIIPGFSLFRGTMRFKLQATVYILMLTAIGFDAFLRQKKFQWWPVAATGAIGLIVGVAALAIHYNVTTNPMGWWHGVMNILHENRHTWRMISDDKFTNEALVAQAGLRASRSLFLASGTCLFLALLLFLQRFSKKLAYAIFALAFLEIMLFARSNRPTFDLNMTRLLDLDRFYTESDSDFRIRCPDIPCMSMSYGTYDIWGRGVGLRRYAEFMAFTQGIDPNLPNVAESDDVPLDRRHRLFRMIRCRLFIYFNEDDEMKVLGDRAILPRLHLIHKWKLLTDRDAIFAAMNRPDFDPGRTVILESSPHPQPVPSEESGTARVVDSSTDHLIIEADVPSPAILLITDAYSSGWRAWPLPGSVQDRYEVMPANYVLRAIPLEVGKHLLRVEYLPWGFVLGKWVSLCSLVLFTATLAWWGRRHYRAVRVPTR